jgi:hypothetical protein
VEVTTPGGQVVEVRRRWMPWRLRKRDWGNPFENPFGLMDGADDLASAAVALVIGIALVLFGGVIITLTLLVGEAVLLLLLLVPLFFAARMFWVLPWIVEATAGDVVLSLEKVRGWRDSEERIQDIAAAYQRGERLVS